MIISNTTAIPPKISIICNTQVHNLNYHLGYVTNILEEHSICIITAKHSVNVLMPQNGDPCTNSSSIFTTNCFASSSSAPPCIPLHPHAHSLTFMVATITFACEKHFGWFTQASGHWRKIQEKEQNLKP
jgi:hypothetical protein